MKEQYGAAQAEDLLEAFGVDQLPVVPEDILSHVSSDDFQVGLHVASFETSDVLGIAEGDREAAMIVLNSAISDPGRRNFTLAHELGHVCLHIMPQSQSRFECGTKELKDYFTDPYEREANGFAAGLLMPKRLIERICELDVRWEDIVAVSRSCQTSLEASYRRLAALSKLPTALIIHQYGRHLRFVPNKFEPYIHNRPLSEAEVLAYPTLDSKTFPEIIVSAGDWVSSAGGTRLERVCVSGLRLADGFSYTILKYDNNCLAETSKV